MSWIRSIVPLVALAPLVAGCQSGDVALQRQSNDILVSPSSIALSLSAPTTVPFAVADMATGSPAVTVGMGTCNGIASFSAPSSVQTIGRNPGVGGSGSSAYGVQPLAVGKCTLRITDTSGNLATIYVHVTQ